jgi:hypothetical protein
MMRTTILFLQHGPSVVLEESEAINASCENTYPNWVGTSTALSNKKLSINPSAMPTGIDDGLRQRVAVPFRYVWTFLVDISVCFPLVPTNSQEPYLLKMVWMMGE